MDVRVHASHTTLGSALRDTAIRKVEHAARFFDGQVSEADVEFVEEGNPRMGERRHRVEITAPVAGQTVRVKATGADPGTAFDVAVDKFERQLRRVKDRLITRARKGSDKRLNSAAAHVDEDTDELRSHGPRIVRAKRFAMKPMSPEEAALQMETLGHSFFFFLNADSGAYAVLYRRRNGDLGLIEAS